MRWKIYRKLNQDVDWPELTDESIAQKWHLFLPILNPFHLIIPLRFHSIMHFASECFNFLNNFMGWERSAPFSGSEWTEYFSHVKSLLKFELKRRKFNVIIKSLIDDISIDSTLDDSKKPSWISIDFQVECILTLEILFFKCLEQKKLFFTDVTASQKTWNVLGTFLERSLCHQERGWNVPRTWKTCVWHVKMSAHLSSQNVARTFHERSKNVPEKKINKKKILEINATKFTFNVCMSHWWTQR